MEARGRGDRLLCYGPVFSQFYGLPRNRFDAHLDSGGASGGLPGRVGTTHVVGVLGGILVAEIVIYQAWLSVPNLLMTLGITAIATAGKVLAAHWLQGQNQNRYFLDRPETTQNFILYSCILSHLPVAIACALIVCLAGKPLGRYTQKLLGLGFSATALAFSFSRL